MKDARIKNIEPAVTIKVSRVLLVTFHSFFVGDEHRHARAVGAVVKDLLGWVIVRIEFHFRLKEQPALAIVEVVTKDRRRRGETGERIKRLAILAFAGESASRTDSGQRDLAIGRPVELGPFHQAVRIFEINRDETVADNADSFELVARLGHQLFRLWREWFG